MAEDLIARIQDRAADPRTRTDQADIALPPRFPPASGAELARSERRLGFRLPPFLGEVYQQVGNGGFGPGYGLIGLPGGFAHDEGKSIVELYHEYHVDSPDDPSWQWPDGLVPVCDWGCATSLASIVMRVRSSHSTPASGRRGVPEVGLRRIARQKSLLGSRIG